MNAILNVALPVFAIMAAGYFAGRMKLLGQDSTIALNGFVYYVSLPALFLGSMARVPVHEVLNGPYLAAVLGGQLAVFGVALIIATFMFPGRIGEVGLHATAAIFANTGYMGIPLLQTAFGDAGTLPAIIATVVNGALMMAVGIIILEIDRSSVGGAHPMKIATDVVKGVAKSPLVQAAVLGLALSALGVSLPKPVNTFLDLLGGAAGPCALFAMGLFLVGQKVTRGAPEVAWITFLKLIIHPLVTWWLATYVLDMDPIWTASAVIMASLPVGGLVFILAQRYQVFLARAVAAILVTTVVSIVTVSFIVAHYVGN